MKWTHSVLMVGIALAMGTTLPVGASDTPNPTQVTITGSLQDELGCPGDWQPDCGTSHLLYDAADDAWQGTFNLPAGSFEYKAALNDSWTENYGQNAAPNGANIPLNLAASVSVKFYYDHESHWVTSNRNSVIATVVGSFQSELGCPGDWQPNCLRSWLQDPDGDGIYSFSTSALPVGEYEGKVAIDESWSENYGAGGALNGANLSFSVPTEQSLVTFTYDASTHVLTIAAVEVSTPPTSVTIAGSLQNEIGCPGDWQPDCMASHLTYDAADSIWQGTFNLPIGSWEYKAALNDSWDKNYGANAALNGANLSLNLAAAEAVKFYFDHESHWVTSNRNSVIATLAGSFQSELGCPGDWQPDCLRSWLQDPDGDGTYTFATSSLPAGDYETKVAIDESWTENYGAGGQQNGANVQFTVPEAGGVVTFSWISATHELTIDWGAGEPVALTVSFDGEFYDLNGAPTTLKATVSGGLPACIEDKPVLFRWEQSPATAPYDSGDSAPANSSGVATTVQTLAPGFIYEVEVEVEDVDIGGDSDPECLGDKDVGMTVVADPNASSTGGGWYKVPAVASPRVNFGYVANVKYDRKRDETATSGNVLWVNTGKWRLQGKISSSGVIACPSVDFSACAVFGGMATLYEHNPDYPAISPDEWINPQELTPFAFTVQDGGTSRVCTSKKNCRNGD